MPKKKKSFLNLDNLDLSYLKEAALKAKAYSESERSKKRKTELVCTKCGERISKDSVIEFDHPELWKYFAEELCRKFAKNNNVPNVAPRPYHKIWTMDRFRNEKLCGPLRESNDGDDYIDWALKGSW